MLKTRNPLKQKSYLTRRTPLAKRSKKQNQVAYQDAKAKKVCSETWGDQCLFQGLAGLACYGRIDPAHIYPKRTYLQIRYHKLNILPACRTHHEYLHGLGSFGIDKMLSKLTAEQRQELNALAAQNKERGER